VTGEQLIKHYNWLVSLMVAGKFRPSYGRRGGFVRFTHQRLDEATALSAWLEERGFHPPMYLAGCFGAHNWCYQPKWDLLRQQRYVTAYHDGTAMNWWELTQRAEDAQRPAPEVQPGQEMLKKRLHHENKVNLCRIHADTGGFNSASEVCQTCQIRERCRG